MTVQASGISERGPVREHDLEWLANRISCVCLSSCLECREEPEDG